ncbi:MAG: hypothetical protein EA378_06985 [Phycisphaerales bacterium]|nr:MAG: hypothetical protein EA378_06985 [Phycisphaerales bacterium]
MVRNVLPHLSAQQQVFTAPPAANEPAAQRVESASGDLRDLADLRRDPEGTRSTIKSRILESRALIPHAQEQLAEAAAARIMLYIDPDFDEYVRQIVAFSGREPDFTGRRLQALDFTPENWKAFADVLGPKRLAITKVRLRSRDEMRLGTNGLTSRSRDVHRFYSRLDPGQANLRVVHIEIPATLPAAPNEYYDGFLVFVFAWDAPRERWVPIQTIAENPKPQTGNMMQIWF